jgi:lysophospholipase L1-like esterase
LFAGNRTDRVIVLSIPDWGQTPFAADRDRDQISREIDIYNGTIQRTTSSANINFIDITPSTRSHASDVEFLAADGLHPSAKEYKVWSEKLVPIIESMMK